MAGNRRTIIEFSKFGCERNGWGGANLFEPFTVTEEYQAEWTKPVKITDIEEVARLHNQQGMTYEQLAKHFNVSLSTIYQALRKSVQAKGVVGAP
jgi:predicted DNA-binding protein (UPF0251 family)